MSNLEHAQKWADALGNDVEALVALYADYPTIQFGKIEDHEVDTLTDADMIREQLGPISAGENGKYTFTATEWLGKEKFGLIHWDVTIEGASTFRGIPTEGKTLTGTGSTYQEFDDQGKILRENTYWEDNRIFEQLGIALMRPHYWEEDFDMEAFLAEAAG
ncbi:hypothetical protein DSM112329_04549 [Paraconexibacter sp. AEG42_29]|uniref:SnoaL-like domain-containing protein n=1 Tax=Paraconexibacter sp. AEG42_29 TaxID=2997339 RepID=A0AAU7B0Z3_9ACTN